MVDEAGTVTINSPETLAAIQYAQELYKTFIPGTESWLDVNNNRAFLAGQVSLTANGVSMYYAAMKDPALAELAADMRSVNLPIGPVGESVELHQASTMSVFPHAVPGSRQGLPEVHLRQRPDERLGAGRQRLLLPAAACLREQPGVDRQPDPRALLARFGQPASNGYAGPLGSASAGAMADYVLVDMFAEAVTGQRSPEDAMRNAERRASRYYR